MDLADLVSGTPFVCGPDTSLREVAAGLAARGHGSAGVVDGRDLVGVITERDLVRAITAGADFEAETARRWMGVDPDVFDPDVDVFDASEWLLASGYRHLPVMDDDELLGIVSIRDLLRAVISSLEEDDEE